MSVADIVDREKIAEKLAYLNGTKTAIADAINYIGEGRGISVSSADTFRSYADKIKSVGKVEIGEATVRTLTDRDSNYKPCKVIEAPENTAWKKVRVYVDAWSAAGSKKTVNYVLLTTEPADWRSGWRNYYVKDGDDYEPITTDVPPVFQTDTYYNKVETAPTNSDPLVITQNGYYDVSDYSRKILGKGNEYDVASSFYVNVQSAELGPFKVQFYDEDGNLLQTVEDVPYGGWAHYKGDPPVSKYNFPFQGWNPAPSSVKSNMKCKPVYYEPQMVANEITDTWAEIIANKGKDYPIGSYKTLPLNITGNEKIHWSSDYRWENICRSACVDVPVQLRNPIMMKVANGEDVSTSSWISVWLDQPEPGTGWQGPFVLQQSIETHTTLYYNRYLENIIIAEDTNKPFGWPTCALRKFLNDGFLETIPEYIRQAIVPVTKVSVATYSNGMVDPYSYAPVQNRFVKTLDTIWVPSIREIAFNSEAGQTARAAGEGIMYTDFNDFALANFDTIRPFARYLYEPGYVLRDTVILDTNATVAGSYHTGMLHHARCMAVYDKQSAERGNSWIGCGSNGTGGTTAEGVSNVVCIGFCL